MAQMCNSCKIVGVERMSRQIAHSHERLRKYTLIRTTNESDIDASYCGGIHS